MGREQVFPVYLFLRGPQSETLEQFPGLPQVENTVPVVVK